MSADAQPEPTADIPPPTWSFWRDLIESADHPAAWRQVGLWAFDRLNEHLGVDWPTRTWEKFGQIPPAITRSSTHTVAYAEMVEFALRLELTRDCHRFPRTKRRLAKNPSGEEVQHLQMQSEVAVPARSPKLRRPASAL